MTSLQCVLLVSVIAAFSTGTFVLVTVEYVSYQLSGDFHEQVKTSDL